MEVTPAHPPRRRHRALKIAFGIVTALVLITAIAAFLLYRSAGKVPQWYQPSDSASADTTQQARQAEDKIAGVQNWAASNHAYEYAKRQGRLMAKKPDDQLVISFSQGEVNSFMGKWYGRFGNQLIDGRRLNDVFRGPMVRIEKDRITFAGAVPPLGGRVVSLDVRPVVKDGMLDLQLLTARSGNLPVPEFTWAKPRQMLIDSLAGMMTSLIPMANMDKGGGANIEAVSAVMAKQGIDSLSHRPTSNVLFLPVWAEQAGLPVRLRNCELADGQITLTTEPLSAEEREKLLYELRGGKQPEKTPIYLTPATRSTP